MRSLHSRLDLSEDGADEATLFLALLVEAEVELVATEVATVASIFVLRSLHNRRLVAGDPSGGGGGASDWLSIVLMVAPLSLGGRHLLLLFCSLFVRVLDFGFVVGLPLLVSGTIISDGGIKSDKSSPVIERHFRVESGRDDSL